MSVKDTMAKYMGRLPHCDEQMNSERTLSYFFQGLIVSKNALRLHEKFGLWEKDAAGNSWANVTDHCLAAAARANILGDWLRLPFREHHILLEAALVHDAFKMKQSEIRKQMGPTLAASKEAMRQEEEALRQENMDPDVIYVESAANFLATPEADRILAKPDAEQTPLELAFLVMYYIDAYTLDADWATGDDINRRIDKTRGDPTKNAERYREVQPLFDGLSRAAHAIQDRLTLRILKNVDGPDSAFRPEDLPLKVDEELRKWAG